MRAVRIEAGDGPVDVLFVAPKWGRIGGKECDAWVQLVGDGDVVCHAAAQVLVGKGVGEKLAHRHWIWVSGHTDGEIHDAHLGRSLSQVVVQATLSCAFLNACTSQAGPGHLGAAFNLLARLGPRCGIEAEKRLLAGVPVQVEDVKVQLDDFAQM